MVLFFVNVHFCQRSSHAPVEYFHFQSTAHQNGHEADILFLFGPKPKGRTLLLTWCEPAAELFTGVQDDQSVELMCVSAAAASLFANLLPH